MKLTVALQRYIQAKRVLGHRFNSDGVILKAFGRAVGSRPLARISPRQVKVYLDGTGPVTSFWHRKWTSLHGFYVFALARGWVNRSPLPRTLPKLGVPFVPYIFSRTELQRLFQQLQHFTAHQRVSHFTLRMLLGLLYGAGLRLNEALRLRLADVDWQTGVLTISDTKFFKTRLVPLAPRLLEQLRQYLREQCRPSSASQAAPVLVNALGHPLTRQQAERAFRRLREQAQIHRTDGSRYQPRLHDLRHSFAVHRLIQWYRQGADVQRLLPNLSTYLGHRNLSGTQRYLTMTAELLQLAGERFEQYATLSQQLE